MSTTGMEHLLVRDRFSLSSDFQTSTGKGLLAWFVAPVSKVVESLDSSGLAGRHQTRRGAARYLSRDG